MVWFMIILKFLIPANPKTNELGLFCYDKFFAYQNQGPYQILENLIEHLVVFSKRKEKENFGHVIFPILKVRKCSQKIKIKSYSIVVPK